MRGKHSYPTAGSRAAALTFCRDWIDYDEPAAALERTRIAA
jgi:hypothetical protein